MPKVKGKECVTGCHCQDLKDTSVGSITNLKISKRKKVESDHTACFSTPVRKLCSFVVPNVLYTNSRLNSHQSVASKSSAASNKNKGDTGSNSKHKEKKQRSTKCLSASIKDYNEMKRSGKCKLRKSSSTSIKDMKRTPKLELECCKTCSCCRKVPCKQQESEQKIYCENLREPFISPTGPGLIENLKCELLARLIEKPANCCACCPARSKQTDFDCCACCPARSKQTDLDCCACCPARSKQTNYICCCQCCPANDNLPHKPAWNCCCQYYSNKNEENCQPIQECYCQSFPCSCQCCYASTEDDVNNQPEVKCYPGNHAKNSFQPKHQGCCCTKKTVPKGNEIRCFCFPLQLPNDDGCLEETGQPKCMCMCPKGKTNERAEFNCQPECFCCCQGNRSPPNGSLVRSISDSCNRCCCTGNQTSMLCQCNFPKVASESLLNVNSKRCEPRICDNKTNNIKTRAYPTKYQSNWNNEKKKVQQNDERSLTVCSQESNETNVSEQVYESDSESNEEFCIKNQGLGRDNENENDFECDCKCNCSDLEMRMANDNKKINKETLKEKEYIKKYNKNKKLNVCECDCKCICSDLEPNEESYEKNQSMRKSNENKENKHENYTSITNTKTPKNGAVKKAILSIFANHNTEDNLQSNVLSSKEKYSLKNKSHSLTRVERQPKHNPNVLKRLCCLTKSKTSSDIINYSSSDSRLVIPNSNNTNTRKCKCCCSTKETNSLANGSICTSSDDDDTWNNLPQERLPRTTLLSNTDYSSSCSDETVNDLLSKTCKCKCSTKKTNSLDKKDHITIEVDDTCSNLPLLKTTCLVNSDHSSSCSNDTLMYLPPSPGKCKCCCSKKYTISLKNQQPKHKSNNNNSPLCAKRKVNGTSSNLPANSRCCSTKEGNYLGNKDNSSMCTTSESDDACNNLPSSYTKDTSNHFLSNSGKCKCCRSTEEIISLKEKDHNSICTKSETQERLLETTCLSNTDHSSSCSNDTIINLPPNTGECKCCCSNKGTTFSKNQALNTISTNDKSCLKNNSCNKELKHKSKARKSSCSSTKKQNKNNSTLCAKREFNDTMSNLPVNSRCCSKKETNFLQNEGNSSICTSSESDDACNNLPSSCYNDTSNHFLSNSGKCKCCRSTEEISSLEKMYHNSICTKSETVDLCNNLPQERLLETTCLSNTDHSSSCSNDTIIKLPPNTGESKCCCSNKATTSLNNQALNTISTNDKSSLKNNSFNKEVKHKSNARKSSCSSTKKQNKNTSNQFLSNSGKCKCCRSTEETFSLENKDHNSIYTISEDDNSCKCCCSTKDTTLKTLPSNKISTKDQISLKKESFKKDLKHTPNVLKRSYSSTKKRNSPELLKSKNNFPLYTKRKSYETSNKIPAENASTNLPQEKLLETNFLVNKYHSSSCSDDTSNTGKSKCSCSTEETLENKNHTSICTESETDDTNHNLSQEKLLKTTSVANIINSSSFSVDTPDNLPPEETISSESMDCSTSNNRPSNTQECEPCCSTKDTNTLENKDHSSISSSSEADETTSDLLHNTGECQCGCSTKDTTLKNMDHSSTSSDDATNKLPPNALKRSSSSTSYNNLPQEILLKTTYLKNKNRNSSLFTENTSNNLPSNIRKCKCCCSTNESTSLKNKDQSTSCSDDASNNLIPNTLSTKEKNSLENKNHPSEGMDNYSDSLLIKRQYLISTEKETDDISNNLPDNTRKCKCCCSTKETSSMEDHCLTNTKRESDTCNKLPTNTLSIKYKNSLKNESNSSVRLENESNSYRKSKTLKCLFCSSTKAKNSSDSMNRSSSDYIYTKKETDVTANNLPFKTPPCNRSSLYTSTILPPNTSNCRCGCSNKETNSLENKDPSPIHTKIQGDYTFNNLLPNTSKCKCCSTKEATSLEADYTSNNLPPYTQQCEFCCSTKANNQPIYTTRESAIINNLPTNTLPYKCSTKETNTSKCKCCCSTKEATLEDHCSTNTKRVKNPLNNKRNSSIRFGKEYKSNRKPKTFKCLSCCSTKAKNSSDSMNHSTSDYIYTKKETNVTVNNLPLKTLPCACSTYGSPIYISNNLVPNTSKCRCCCSNSLENKDPSEIDIIRKTDYTFNNQPPNTLQCKCCCSTKETDSLNNTSHSQLYTRRNSLNNKNLPSISSERESKVTSKKKPPTTLKRLCCCSTSKPNSLKSMSTTSSIYTQREVDDGFNNQPSNTQQCKCCCSTVEADSLKNKNHHLIRLEKESKNTSNKKLRKSRKRLCCCTTSKTNSLESVSTTSSIYNKREADDAFKNQPSDTQQCKCCCSNKRNTLSYKYSTEVNCWENKNHGSIYTKREADYTSNHLPSYTPQCECCCSIKDSNLSPVYTKRYPNTSNNLPAYTIREADYTTCNVPPNSLPHKYSTKETNCLENENTSNNLPPNTHSTKEADFLMNKSHSSHIKRESKPKPKPKPKPLKRLFCCVTKNTSDSSSIYTKKEAKAAFNNRPPNTLQFKCDGSTRETDSLKNENHSRIYTEREVDDVSNKCKCVCLTEEIDSLKTKNNSRIRFEKESKDTSKKKPPKKRKSLCCCSTSKTSSLKSVGTTSSIYSKREADDSLDKLPNTQQCKCCCSTKVSDTVKYRSYSPINSLENKDHISICAKRVANYTSNNLPTYSPQCDCCCSIKETEFLKDKNSSQVYTKIEADDKYNNQPIYTTRKADIISNLPTHALPYKCSIKETNTEREADYTSNNLPPYTPQFECCCSTKVNNQPIYTTGEAAIINNLPTSTLPYKCSTKETNTEREADYTSKHLPPYTQQCECCCSTKANNQPIYTTRESVIINNLPTNTLPYKCSTKETNTEREADYTSNNLPPYTPQCECCCSTKETESLKDQNCSLSYTKIEADDKYNQPLNTRNVKCCPCIETNYLETNGHRSICTQRGTTVARNNLPPKIDLICEESEVELLYSTDECTSDQQFESTNQAECESTTLSEQSEIKVCFTADESPSNMSEEILKKLSAVRGNYFKDLIDNEECGTALHETIKDICTQQLANRKSTSASASFASMRDAECLSESSLPCQKAINCFDEESEIELHFSISKEILDKLAKIRKDEANNSKYLAEEKKTSRQRMSQDCLPVNCAPIDYEESEIELEFTTEVCSSGYLVEPANLECECPALEYLQMEKEAIGQLYSCLTFCEIKNRGFSKGLEIGLHVTRDKRLLESNYSCHPIKNYIFPSSEPQKFSLQNSSKYYLLSSPEYKKNITFKNSEMQYKCCSPIKNYNYRCCSDLASSNLNVHLEESGIELRKSSGKCTLDLPLALKYFKCQPKSKDTNCQKNYGKTAAHFEDFCRNNSEKQNSQLKCPIICEKQIVFKEFAIELQSTEKECLFECKSCTKLEHCIYSASKIKSSFSANSVTDKDFEELEIELRNSLKKLSMGDSIHNDSIDLSEQQNICFKNISTQQSGIELQSTTSKCFLDCSIIKFCNGQSLDRNNNILDDFNNCSCCSNSVQCKQNTTFEESGIEPLKSEKKFLEYECGVEKRYSNYQILEKRKDLFAAASSIHLLSTNLKADLDKSKVKFQGSAERCPTKCRSSKLIQNDSCKFSKKHKNGLNVLLVDKSNISVEKSGIELRNTSENYALDCPQTTTNVACYFPTIKEHTNWKNRSKSKYCSNIFEWQTDFSSAKNGEYELGRNSLSNIIKDFENETGSKECRSNSSKFNYLRNKSFGRPSAQCSQPLKSKLIFHSNCTSPRPEDKIYKLSRKNYCDRNKKKPSKPKYCEEAVPAKLLRSISRVSALPLECGCNLACKMSLDGECFDKDCSVRVAVRIRPQNSRELIDMCRICTTVIPKEPQIVLGMDKAFTFDFVFDANSNQGDIYMDCVERLVEGALRGYNATVLAYGQTGSGKTFTMGTGFERETDSDQQGIIPRAVGHIFAGIEEIQSRDCEENKSPGIEDAQFSVAVQFMELYNEDIIDLLDPYNKGRVCKIHEDASGQISVTGVTIKPIHGPQEALKCLQQGALARTTASTQMNDQSSRSHALFTILIRRQRIINNDLGIPGEDLETLTSKFNFVDLAGSERLKRTGATGERAREGISINCGLLALGNCISALGDKSKRATHIPYRDSKLTRLLQDSLGGNSQTLMIACVSPSDRDFMETLNTLKYANRARNIKNKVQLNQDQSSRTISQLRREIAALQLELLEYKQGKRLTDAEGNSSLSDTFHENALLMADNKRLQQRIKAMQETINVLTEKNVQLKLEHDMHGWSSSVDSDRSVSNMVAGYLSEIEKLQAKLIESEEMYHQLKKTSSTQNTPRGMAKMNTGYVDPDDLINLAKRELEKNREMLMSRSLPGFQEDNCNNGDNPNESCESDESDDESDDKTNEIQADINDINSDIEMKSKLIEQLELSQQRMQLMRQHYEEKLTVLNCKIVNTQKERDEVLANMGPSHGNQPNDKVKKVRDEYERKINDMQRELKKLQQAEREHARQQREVKAQEAKLRNLRNELAELKSIKTRLIRKMTEQTTRHKEEDTRKIREIAQLRKEQRRQENTVKSLQAKMQAKDQILKRKTEEVSALRRSQRGSLSIKAAGRVPVKNDPYAFNSRVARQRWDNMSRAISRAARNKQVIVQLEKELERLIKERETLSHDLASVRNRQKMSKNTELANEEDTIKSNLNYVQENIEHVQQAIMDFEETKETKETPINNNLQNLQILIGNIRNVDEAKFLLERLADSAIMFSCNSALTESRLVEHETLLKEAQQESGIQQQLLQHFLAQNNTVQISDLFESLNLGGTKLSSNLSGSQKSLISNGTYDIPSEGNMSGTNVIQQRLQSRSPSPTATVDLTYEKIRRRTAQPQDLLFGDSEVTHNGEDVMTRSFTQPISSHVHPLMRVPSAPGSLKQSLNSPLQAKKSNETPLNVAVPQSPRLSRRVVSNKGSSGLEDNDLNPTQSPPVYRRMISRDDNINNYSDVFSRLGAGTQDPSPGGSIQKATGKIRVGVPLHCTHTVLGHNNSVLSIKVDDNILYTASADRTVKVWDLTKETAQHCLSTHPGPVVAVQNDRNTGLLFSASGPYVRVWDLRTSNTKPIKTFSSSGQLLSGSFNISGVAAGESPITALCIGESGNLYMAASDKVRIWDLKNMACIGKLSGGHQAAVMCVTSWAGDGDDSTDFVATGSKDHYVKVFEVPRTGGVIYPILNLEPPHYDGVQALAVARDAVGADAELFSGSRDSGIKRWDLKSGELKQSLNNAHKGWISGMAISGDILLSSCRGGIIRLWNVKNCENIAEMKTGLMINDIVASGQRVFTASSEGKVRIWRLTNALRRQCSMNDS